MGTLEALKILQQYKKRDGKSRQSRRGCTVALAQLSSLSKPSFSLCQSPVLWGDVFRSVTDLDFYWKRRSRRNIKPTQSPPGKAHLPLRCPLLLATDKVHNVTRNANDSSENSLPGRHRATAQNLCATLPREAVTGTLALGTSFSHLQHLTPAGAGAAPVQAVIRELYPEPCTGALTSPNQNQCLSLRVLLHKH